MGRLLPGGLSAFARPILGEIIIREIVRSGQDEIEAEKGEIYAPSLQNAVKRLDGVIGEKRGLAEGSPSLHSFWDDFVHWNLTAGKIHLSQSLNFTSIAINYISNLRFLPGTYFAM